MDVGCGPGYTALDLARAVGPEGRIIAVDRDGERSLPLLKARTESAGFTNVETQVTELSHTLAYHPHEHRHPERLRRFSCAC